MNENLKMYCDLFVSNKNLIKESFGWESIYMYPLCAGIYTQKKRQADVRRMKECRDFLKEHTSVFSNFRGNAQMALVSILAMSKDPEDLLEKGLRVYGLLKQEFFSSEFLVFGAMAIADMAEEEQYAEAAERTRRIYKLMKNSHPFLTSSEDSAFAALLAMSAKTDKELEMEVERCFEELKRHFSSQNSVQSLSHVLTLGEGDASWKCSHTVELFQFLKEQGYKYGVSYELPSLGILGTLGADTKLLAGSMIEVDHYLKGQKGFGSFGIGAKQRLMYAGILASIEYLDNLTGEGAIRSIALESTAITSTITIMAIQQAAMMAAIAASSAAAAAAASASSN